MKALVQTLDVVLKEDVLQTEGHSHSSGLILYKGRPPCLAIFARNFEGDRPPWGCGLEAVREEKVELRTQSDLQTDDFDRTDKLYKHFV